MIWHWQEFDGNAAQLVVVSCEAVYAQRIDALECRLRLDRLQACQSPAEMFGPEATRVPLASITCVLIHHDACAIEFSLRGGKQARTVVLRVGNPGLCGEIFAAIGQALLARSTEDDNPCLRTQPGLEIRIRHWLARLATSTAAAAESRRPRIKSRAAPAL